MANKNIPDIFNEVAKAIQKKTGETSALDPVDFGQKIEDIPQEIIVHGDMDEAFDEAVGDYLWEDGYFLGYYNRLTKEVQINLTPIMAVDSESLKWTPAACLSSGETYDVGIQEIAIEDSTRAEINPYKITFDSDESSASTDLNNDQFVITQLSMGSSSTEEFEPTGVIESAKYKTLKKTDLYNITSSGSSWKVNALTTEGELYIISSGGYAKMKFIDGSSSSTISSDPTIYKYLGNSSEDEYNKLYDLGSDNGLYVIDSSDSSLIYKAYTDKTLPADGDILQAQFNGDKLELVDYSNPLESGYFYYYDGNSFDQQTVYSDRPYYSTGEDLIEFDIPEGLQYISKDSSYTGGYEFENANIDANYAYEYNGGADFSRINSGLYYIDYGCEGVQEITNVSEGYHYTYNGYGSFKYYDAFSGLNTGTVYNYNGGESFTALDSYALYFIDNDCGGTGYTKIDYIDNFKCYTYSDSGSEVFTELNTDTFYYYNTPYYSETSYAQALSIDINKLYLCTYVDPQYSVVGNERTLINIELPQSSGDSTAIVINGEHYTLTKD